MRARYEFTEKQVNELPLTMEFTATLPEWQHICDQLANVTNGRADMADPAKLKPLQDCVKNLVHAIREATGVGYNTRGYSYSCERDPAKNDTAA